MQQARKVLALAQRLIKDGRFDQALDRLGTVQTPETADLRAEVFYWQGRALLGRSAGQKAEAARRDQRRAGLAFMRVVIHFPGHRYAAECLYRAGELCRASGQHESAARLWLELIRCHPAAAPWTDRAREALSTARPEKPG
jgi:TolA-binding protein